MHENLGSVRLLDYLKWGVLVSVLYIYLILKAEFPSNSNLEFVFQHLVLRNLHKNQ